MKKMAIAFFLTFAVLPLAAGMAYAALYSIGLVGGLAKGFDLSAWGETLANSAMWLSIGLSVLVATIVVLISTTLALLLLITMRGPLEQPLNRFVLHFPLAVPPIVAAFISFQWLGNTGMLSRAAYAASLIKQPEQFPALINDPFYWGVGLTLVMCTFPFFLLVFLQQFHSENLLQYTQLAATLGASPAQVNRQVLLPVLLRRAAPTLLLYAVFLFGAYEVPLLLGRQNPAMISVFISQKFNRFNLADLPAAYTATLVYAVFVMTSVLLFLVKNRLRSQRLSA